MCQDCGCAEVNQPVHIQAHHHTHTHTHDHLHVDDQTHTDTSDHAQTHTVSVQKSLLAKNDHIAAHNRQDFRSQGLLVLNVLSSPGSGKTALIERLVRDQQDSSPVPPALRVGVIVGDLATDHDAQRLRQAGAPAVQITTGNACHLEAAMIANAAVQLDLASLNVLVIENVGNLVCPAAYDLGETLRVVLLSVTEGEDKPLKYPTMFKTADVVLITKVDLAEAVGFDRAAAIATIQQVAPQAKLFELSARTGQGLVDWYDYLKAAMPQPMGV